MKNLQEKIESMDKQEIVDLLKIIVELHDVRIPVFGGFYSIESSDIIFSSTTNGVTIYPI